MTFPNTAIAVGDVVALLVTVGLIARLIARIFVGRPSENDQPSTDSLNAPVKPAAHLCDTKQP
jgi:hypothetical protein